MLHCRKSAKRALRRPTTAQTRTNGAKKRRFTPPRHPIDIENLVTTKVIWSLEAESRPWHEPWLNIGNQSPITPARRHDGRAYRGINRLWLGFIGAQRGYSSPIWMTAARARWLGGYVARNATPTTIAQPSRNKLPERALNGPEHRSLRTTWNAIPVFNVVQLNGMSCALPTPLKPHAERSVLNALRSLVTATGANIRYGSYRAGYDAERDLIDHPALSLVGACSRTSFRYALLLLLIRWASHPGRCVGYKWTQHGEAMDHLVSDIAIAFLCEDLGLRPPVDDDAFARFERQWIEVLQQDQRAIFVAAERAQQIVDYLWARQPSSEKSMTTRGCLRE